METETVVTLQGAKVGDELVLTSWTGGRSRSVVVKVAHATRTQVRVEDHPYNYRREDGRPVGPSYGSSRLGPADADSRAAAAQSAQLSRVRKASLEARTLLETLLHRDGHGYKLDAVEAALATLAEALNARVTP